MSFINIQHVNSIVLDNVELWFDKVELQLNGSFSREPAFGVAVKLIQQETSWFQTKYTDPTGRVIFSANSTGVYKVEALYENYFYQPRIIYVNISTQNVFHDIIVKKGSYLYQSQISIFRELQLYLPCVFSLTFPLSTNVNFTLESYGLHASIDKGPDYITVTPKDASDIVLISNQSYYYPNYTINISFKTIEEGSVNLRIISEGKFLTNVAPLYLVPKNADVRFSIVIHVSKPFAQEQLTETNEKLDTVINMLVFIRDILAFTIAPNVTKWDQKYAQYIDKYYGNTTLIEIYSWIKQLRTITDNTRNDISGLRTTVTQTINNALSSYLKDFQNTSYIIMFVAIIMIITVILTFAQRREKKKATQTDFVKGKIINR